MSGTQSNAADESVAGGTLVSRYPRAPLLRFLGGTETVTGSRFLVDTPRARVLVDCGLYQGLKELRLRNWADFPVDPASIDSVVLTHAHVDHSGYLPALYRAGFRGRVHSTPATSALCRVVLPDSARLQEEEAAYRNRKGFTRHDPARALFGQADAERILERFAVTDFGTPVDVADGVRVVFQPAGHILGSATVSLALEREQRTLAFSGDLGRGNHPILRSPPPPPPADVLIVESTYGDREHLEDDVVERLARTVTDTAERGGVVVIPAFAVDRTELVLLHLRLLMEAGRVPVLPVFVDSPMALDALAIYREAIAECSAEVQPELCEQGGDPFALPELIEARHPESSKAINDETGPAIIVSASGMATGGRVLHHLARRLPDPRNTVALVGFQAAATRGRSLLSGASSIKMLGRYVPVLADVVDLTQFSVHADRSELLDWLRGAPAAPEITYVVHGEPEASAGLRGAIESSLGWCAVVPRYRECVRVDRAP